MKDTRFIELVNLYIDRQISPEEQAELELEIQSNPRRRQVYLQYCRMHRATKLVYESFRAHSGQENQPARLPTTIARLESQRRQRRARWVYAAGGLAAAACFALVVARVNFISGVETPKPNSTLAAAQTTPPAAPAAVAAHTPPTDLPQARHAELRPSLLVEVDHAAMLAALREEEERLMSLPRAGSQPRVVSLFEDGVFDSRQNAFDRLSNQSRQRQPQQRIPVEFTAFQFQR